MATWIHSGIKNPRRAYQSKDCIRRSSGSVVV